jgi:hypothetical protein
VPKALPHRSLSWASFDKLRINFSPFEMVENKKT